MFSKSSDAARCMTQNPGMEISTSIQETKFLEEELITSFETREILMGLEHHAHWKQGWSSMFGVTIKRVKMRVARKPERIPTV